MNKLVEFSSLILALISGTSLGFSMPNFGNPVAVYAQDNSVAQAQNAALKAVAKMTEGNGFCVSHPIG